jgi:hypothetical protein
MLRAALALLSTLQIGARIKRSLSASPAGHRHLPRRGGVAYRRGSSACLRPITRWSPSISSALEAAAIMAACLLLIRLILVAILPLVGRQPKRASSTPLVARGDGAGLIDQGVGKAMQQVGPVPLVAIAFLAGLLASRR